MSHHAVLALVCLLGPTDPSADVRHPKQGVAEMLLEYMAVRYKDIATHGDLLYVSAASQRMYHVRDGRLIADYDIATARNGLGCRNGSYRTPTGLHRIAGKFGDGVPPFGVLKEREFTGELADPDFAGADKDWITSRVLWLEGLEDGHNRGGDVDSHDRYIYIHGTANERSIGSPSSRGCVRMRNRDVIELFDRVPVGTLVVILPN
jgi:hypothetical protein